MDKILENCYLALFSQFSSNCIGKESLEREKGDEGYRHLIPDCCRERTLKSLQCGVIILVELSADENFVPISAWLDCVVAYLTRIFGK